MQGTLSRHHFLIVDNPRLDFEESRTAVRSFIRDRINTTGATCDFLPDLSAAEAHIDAKSVAGSKSPHQYVVVSDIMNPFIDFDLVDSMSRRLDRTGAVVVACEGAIPGTEVMYVTIPAVRRSGEGKGFPMGGRVGEAAHTVLRWNSQAEFNTQLNLYKFKRLKIFLALTRRFPGLSKLSIRDLMAKFGGDEAFSIISAFGENVRQIHYAVCPHCGGGLHSLNASMSQPMCGYLPTSRPMYHECEKCGLVVQSPSIHEEDVYRIYDKWDRQDFVATTSNPYIRGAVRCDLGAIVPHLPVLAKTLDLGGGMGAFSRYLKSEHPDWDVTHSDFEIKAGSTAGVISRTLDFTREPIGSETFDLVSAWEVLEHVPYDRLAFVIENIWRSLRPGGFFIFSTPDFDSPLCRSFDFYSVAPPFHYLVFGERWLRRYFSDSEMFDIFDVRHCSDFLDDAINWYEYGTRTAPTLALRGTAQLLRKVFELDASGGARRALADMGLGTEVVMTLRKRPSRNA